MSGSTRVIIIIIIITAISVNPELLKELSRTLLTMPRITNYATDHILWLWSLKRIYEKLFLVCPLGIPFLRALLFLILFNIYFHLSDSTPPPKKNNNMITG